MHKFLYSFGLLFLFGTIGTFGAVQSVFSASLANNTVTTSVMQSDGKVLIGGDFTSYNDESHGHIVRLNVDGSVDNTFSGETNGSVYSIAVQPDGKILVGGNYNSCNGVARNRIARLNADGSLDTSFDPGDGVEGNRFSGSPVTDLVIQDDGKIIIVGDFATYDNIARNNIARLNTDGSLDTSFDPGDGTDYDIECVMLQSDGKIIIGGGFYRYDDNWLPKIVRINTDGSLDMSFVAELTGLVDITNIDDGILQPNGKIIIATETTEDTEQHIVRLNTDGSVDTSFDSGESWVDGDGFGGSVRTLTLQSDGKILIGGYFSSYKGAELYDVIRINSDGSHDMTFVSGSGVYLNMYSEQGEVYTIEILSDDSMIVGGYFDQYDGNTSNYLVRLDESGVFDPLFGGEDNDSNGITTDPVSDITDISATGNAEINFNFLDCSGWDPPGACYHEFDRYIQWGTENGNYTEFCDAGRDYSGFYSCELTGLTPSTTYYVQAFIDEIGGEGEVANTYMGNEITFTTNSSGGGIGTGDRMTAPQNLNITVSENLTLDCGSSVDLDNGTSLVAGTPQTNTTTCQVTTNDQSGYNLSLTDDRSINNALYHTTQSTTQDGQIQDKTPWTNTTPNAQTWTGTGLGFGILSSTATKNESWWGNANSCNDATQLYAGLPNTDTNIMEHASYSNTHTDTTICYKLDISSTQLSGEYIGSVTYTASGRP